MVMCYILFIGHAWHDLTSMVDMVSRTATVLHAQGVCNFSVPLGDVEAVDPAPGSPVVGPVRLEFGDTEITTSLALTVDSTSIIYTGYTNSSGNFVGAVRILSSAYMIGMNSYIFFQL